MTMTASFFGGPVAAKPATATTRRSQLAVRASMDSEKSVAESGNTRWASCWPGWPQQQRRPSQKSQKPHYPAFYQLSEYNNQILVSSAGKLQDVQLLTFGSVLKAEKKEFFTLS
ncbi:hypothetical protein SASPL_139189 [Salvia splendens]|uniref:Uncharacterized protein n=1 Tax=Salvia splendens TaxID=180675 RepID=A0A8X8ZEU8_SALSN|nr:hypothetical protein SASPL_139189 [Salvia splendens]